MAKTKKRTASGRVRAEREGQKHEVATRRRCQHEMSTEEANPTGHEETEMPLTYLNLCGRLCAPWRPLSQVVIAPMQPSVGGDSSGASTSAM